MRILRGLCLDIGIWFAAPAVFLFFYVGRFFLPSTAILPHLRLMLLGFVALLIVRAVFYRLMPNRLTAVVASALVATAMLASIIAYYALVLTGLNYWARVVSWDLMRTYAHQLPALADALGLSLGYSVAVVIAAIVILFVASTFYFWRNDWLALSIQRSKTPLSWFLIAAGLFGGAVEAYSFAAAPPTREREPIGLTLFPVEASYNLQGHAVDKVQVEKLGAEDDRARSAYVVNPKVDRKNIVLIVVDALRSDHMALFGYQRDTTPNIARIATSATLRKAGIVHSSCADSSCGLLSLASSLFVHQFPARPFTLQEVLKRTGYRVHMILGGDHTNFYGLRKIYGAVDSYYDGASTNRYYVNDDDLVLDRLASFPSWDGSPTMIQFHLMSVHVLGTRWKSSNNYLPASNYAAHADRRVATRGETSSEAVNYYDNGVAQADAIIGRVLSLLADKGYLKNTLVIITGDHGEGLGEHGFYAHANNVFEQVLSIPVVFLSFGYRPTAPIDVRPDASQVDIAPSILEELAIPRPATWIGVPLQSPQGPEFTYFQEKLDAGVFDQRDPAHIWKYFINTRSGKEVAFDISKDPQESVDRLATVAPRFVSEWRAKVLPTYGTGVFVDAH
jgi:glucan phosphoethanolaminetransferase (alkaline phosphatase superfamily)